MLEYIIVILVVSTAVYFTAKKLIAQTKCGSCDGCSCGVSKELEELAKLNRSIVDKKNGVDS